jgi:hypothetical protein
MVHSSITDKSDCSLWYDLLFRIVGKPWHEIFGMLPCVLQQQQQQSLLLEATSQ